MRIVVVGSTGNVGTSLHDSHHRSGALTLVAK
jgi:dihydrodipicolinate reductase